MEVLINKHIIEKFLQCSKDEVHRIFSSVRAKCPTTTAYVHTQYEKKSGVVINGMVSLESCFVDDVEKVANKMLSNITNKKINKETWKTILKICEFARFKKGKQDEHTPKNTCQDSN